MKVGDYVQITGLQKAQQHNGSVGVIKGTRADHRWVVKKHTGETLAICASNMSTTIRLPMLPSNETPTCLGGGEYCNSLVINNVNNNNNNDSHQVDSSTFHRLERPSSKDLDDPHFVVFPIANTMLKETYLKIYCGDCEVSYNHSLDPVTGLMAIHFKVSVEEHLDVFEAGIFATKSLSQRAQNYDRNFWGDSLDSIDDRLTEYLHRRILHLTIRSAGATLLGKDATVAIARHCCCNYTNLKQHKEDLDCAILCVDVLLCCLPTPVTEKNLQEIRENTVRVAEILECLGRFVEAAELYLYIPQVYYNDNPLELCEGQHNAALAYKRARDFENSEKCNILALQNKIKMSPQNWDANGALGNITDMYWDWALANATSPDDIRVGEPCTEIDAMNWVWNILLMLAGSKAMFTYNCSWPHIKREFWPQRAAAAAIKSALESSGSVADFRAKILACASDVAKRNGVFVMDEALALAYKSDKATSRRDEKSAARKGHQQQHRFLLGKKRGDEPETCCDNPECTVVERDKLLICPCHKVQYCGKECQRFHWNSHHKHVCPFPKKNRKKQEQQQPPQGQGQGQQEKLT